MEVPTRAPLARNRQTDLEEQIRAAQMNAVDEKRLIAGAVAATIIQAEAAFEEQKREKRAIWEQQYQWIERPAHKSRLPIGTTVSVENFPAQDLVGQKGVVLEYHAGMDRYVVEIDVPKKEGKEATTTKLSLRVGQLQIEKIPVSANRDTSKVEETLLSANAEPFNPMAPSMLEWAAAQGGSRF